jgi:hypothetical protein
MTAEKLLQSLSEWKPSGTGRHSLAVQLPGGGTARVTADRADALSCAIWELALDRAAPVGGVRAWGEAVAARATGLLEPLKLLEADETRGEAVLRSTAPAAKGDTLAYYEVRLTADGRAAVARYTASRAHSGREQVAFALTHEAIAKLAADLAA